MADHVSEVTFPEGVLRVEVDAVDLDKSGHVTVYLNGERISKERAQEIIDKSLRRMGQGEQQ
jgi:hypothetical protein